MIIPLISLNFMSLDGENCLTLTAMNKKQQQLTPPKTEYFDKTLTGNFGVVYSNYTASKNVFVYKLFNQQSFYLNTTQVTTLKAANNLFQDSRNLDPIEKEALLRAFESQIIKSPTRKNRF